MAAGEQKYPVTFVIGAVDKLTGKIREINKDLRAFTAPYRESLTKINNSVRELAGETGFGRFTNAFKKTRDVSHEVWDDLKGTAFRFGALGVAGALAIERIESGFANLSNKISDNAEALGVTTTAYQRLMGGATVAGADPEALNSALGRFSKNIGEAAAGSGEARLVFRAMGVAIKDSAGKVRSLTDILPDVAEGLSKIQNANVRNFLGVALFGKTFREIVPVISKGRQGLKDLGDEAERMNGVLSPEIIERGDALYRTFARVKLAVSGAVNILAAELAPVVSDLAEKFTKWLGDNRAQIGQWAKNFAAELPSVLERIGNLLKPFANLFMVVANHAGVLNGVLTAMEVIFASKLVIGLFKIGSALSGMLPFIGEVAVAIGALLATPAGAFVALGALIAGAGYLIYKNWQRLPDLWTALKKGWEDLIAGFRSGGQALASLLPKEWRTKLGIDFSPASAPGASSGAPAMLGVPGFQFPLLPQGAPAFSGGGPIPLLPVSSRTPLAPDPQKVSVQVDFSNLPQGTKVSSDAKGAALDVNMGWSGLVLT